MKQAMIFAAGLGTRLKPLTDTMPKALVRVGGEPLLKRVVSRLGAAGFNHLVVNMHHFASQITNYLQANDNFGLDIRVSDETAELLDTGGGLRKAQPLFAPRCPILIHNVDILSNVDLDKFYRADWRVNCPDCGVPHLMAGARLLVSWRKTKRYLVFNDQMLLVGWVNIVTGEVKSLFPEVRAQLQQLRYPLAIGDEPLVVAGHLHLFAFSGIHAFSPTLFPQMVGWPNKFPIMDFYLKACATTPIMGYVKPDLRLMDVGKIDTLSDADDFVSTLVP